MADGNPAKYILRPHWAAAVRNVQEDSFEKELEFYELLDLDAEGEDDLDVDNTTEQEAIVVPTFQPSEASGFQRMPCGGNPKLSTPPKGQGSGQCCWAVGDRRPSEHKDDGIESVLKNLDISISSFNILPSHVYIRKITDVDILTSDSGMHVRMQTMQLTLNDNAPTYKNTMIDSPRPLQPHLYDLAASLLGLCGAGTNRRQLFQVGNRGITGSGKSSSQRLILNQVLGLCILEKGVEEKALKTLLDSFGGRKNTHESQCLLAMELHFNKCALLMKKALTMLSINFSLAPFQPRIRFGLCPSSFIWLLSPLIRVGSRGREAFVCDFGCLVLWRLRIIVWHLPRKILLRRKSSSSINLDFRPVDPQVHRPCPSRALNPHLGVGQNGFDEFCTNFAYKMLQSYKRMIRDTVALPSISTMDNGACIELLRGAQLRERSQRKPDGLVGIINKACSSYKSGKGGEQRDEEKDLTSKFTVHASFVLIVTSLESTITRAQVPSRPLRNPSPVIPPDNALPTVQDEHPRLDPGKMYPVTSQLDFALSEIFASLERAKLWTISCIRPNDSAHKAMEYIADYDLTDFCERYVPYYKRIGRGEDCSEYWLGYGVTRMGNDGTKHQSPNVQYDSGGLQDRGVWGSDYDKKDLSSPPEMGSLAYSSGGCANEVANAVEEVFSTKTRRWWLWLVRLTTWWMPNFILRIVGRMERPGIRFAWREKVTIFFLIFLFNGSVTFYIVELGRLLCPNFDKTWGPNEVLQHEGSNDYWVAVQRAVHDVSNFVNGDRQWIIIRYSK
ncbi:hypothetical protein BYT27DRAFT_7335855 [Phlegmacium glaucopus]|nr:hypothetical protein BYT27DRAFT_7335855 [Phlegmacium glaucopus]